MYFTVFSIVFLLSKVGYFCVTKIYLLSFKVAPLQTIYQKFNFEIIIIMPYECDQNLFSTVSLQENK